ncbi:MAG TPA: 3-oxoacyl-[acyl-carrier-protein] synthase III C-terminal domain-containing protein [Syntrophomonas sp.]|nr:3-oxoacyl-[acyl-carrier-protein] synthase III C-terminal domain-containing protein [Syntrophomonas sp.]
MIGIKSFGAYIPRYRMNRKVIAQAIGWFSSVGGKGERSVANFDEDAITMAVAAGMDCLGDLDKSNIDALYLASTSLPYKERQNAGIVTAALGLGDDIFSADMTGSIKSGTAALLAALNAVKAENAKEALVTASDMRLGKPASPEEASFGDGGAAFLIGSEDVVASFEGSYSLSYDFVDIRRDDKDRFGKTWEPRWVRDEGFFKMIPEAVSGLLKKYDLNIRDFSKVIYPCPSSRDVAAMAKKLGMDSSQIADDLQAVVGNTGSAYTPMMLVNVLQEAKPGDKILAVSFGNGCDALYFQVTEKISEFKPIKGVKGYLNITAELNNYIQYLVFRDILPVETGIRGEHIPPTQLSQTWRLRDTIMGLYGSKCLKCGTVQYPVSRVCVNPACEAVDQMELYRFAEKKGTVISYTSDSLAFTPNPPQSYCIIDFEGGGRNQFDLTDCDPKQLSVGMNVAMTFRRKYYDANRSIHFYYWKAIPTIEA